jgi:hypothetical protein
MEVSPMATGVQINEAFLTLTVSLDARGIEALNAACDFIRESTTKSAGKAVDELAAASAAPETPKRGRGRPKKPKEDEVAEELDSSVDHVDLDATDTVVDFDDVDDGRATDELGYGDESFLGDDEELDDTPKPAKKKVAAAKMPPPKAAAKEKALDLDSDVLPAVVAFVKAHPNGGREAVSKMLAGYGVKSVRDAALKPHYGKLIRSLRERT